jgi:hypothetical protein
LVIFTLVASVALAGGVLDDFDLGLLLLLLLDLSVAGEEVAMVELNVEMLKV